MASSEVEQMIADHPAANGLVVVLTNDYNDPSILRVKLNPLKECHEDGVEMKKTFSDHFRFACLWKKNSTAIEIIRVIAQMSRCEYPSCYKCLAVVFSGHGEENVLFGSDGKKISIEEELIGPLQPSELPNMRTTPKLFFIDACRGKMTMIPAVKSKGSPEGIEKGGYFIAYSTTLGYRSYTRGEKSKWMPMVAQRLRSSDQSVQDIVAEIASELREDMTDMMCPEYVGQCQPVYLHRLDNIESVETDHRYCHYSGIIAAVAMVVISMLLGLWWLPSYMNTVTTNTSVTNSSSSSNSSSTILSISELIDALPRSINNTSHFCECLELASSKCTEILSRHTSPEDQTTDMMKQWWLSYERVDRTWQKIVNSLTCNKYYKEAVILAKNKGGNTWYKLMYKSPIPPYMFISVLSVMREVANGTYLPHPRPSPS